MIKKVLIFLLCLSAFLLISCYGYRFADVYDNERLIASRINSYSLTGVSQQTQDSSCTVSVDIMEGMNTLWSCRTQEDQTPVQFSLHITMYSGTLKVVLISPDRALTTLSETSGQQQWENSMEVPLEKGQSRIKLVTGEDTSFQLTLTCSQGSFHDL